MSSERFNTHSESKSGEGLLQRLLVAFKVPEALDIAAVVFIDVSELFRDVLAIAKSLKTARLVYFKPQ